MKKWKCMRCKFVWDSENPRKCPECGASGNKLRRVANWKSHALGRPRRGSEEDKLKQIYDLLPENGSRIRAADLVKKAREKRISPTTLFFYLDKLIKNNQAVKEIASVERKGRGAPWVVYYKRLGLPIIILPISKESILLPGKSKLEQFLQKEPPKGKAVGILAGIDWDLKIMTEIISSALRYVAKHRMPREKAVEYMDTVLKIYVRPLTLQLGHLIASHDIDERYLEYAQRLITEDTTQLHEYAFGKRKFPLPLRIYRCIRDLRRVEQTKKKQEGGEKS
jgi:rubredoxin